MERIQNRVEYARMQLSDVMVIGNGTIGSEVAVSMARGGARSLALFDGDEYQPENIGMQLFDSERYLGLPKPEALRGLIHSLIGTDVNIFISTDNYDGEDPFPEETTGRNIVMICTDSLESRREIGESLPWEKGLIVVDVRMGSKQGMIVPARNKEQYLASIPEGEGDAVTCGMSFLPQFAALVAHRAVCIATLMAMDRHRETHFVVWDELK